MVLPLKPIPPRKQRKEIKISWIKLYQNVAQDATPKNFINMAKINLAIKNINAPFANINLHRLIQNTEDNANILLALFAASARFFITIMTIIQIIAARTRNVIIHSFR